MKMFFEECQKDIEKILALAKPKASEDNATVFLVLAGLRRKIIVYLAKNPAMAEDVRMKSLLIQLEQAHEMAGETVAYVRVTQFERYWKEIKKG